MSSEIPPDQSLAQTAILSTISSLKEIVTIVAGLTVSNAIVQLIASANTAAPPSLRSVDFQTLLLFCLLIMNVIRFYHGNIRHLDSTYTAELGKGDSGHLQSGGGRKIALDFLVIFLQSLLFAVLSFLLRDSTEFYFLFTALLVVDVLWFFGIYQFTTDRKVFEHQKRWTFNNLVAVFALLIVISVQTALDPAVRMYILWFILAINSVADFSISWDFYFPPFSVS